MLPPAAPASAESISAMPSSARPSRYALSGCFPLLYRTAALFRVIRWIHCPSVLRSVSGSTSSRAGPVRSRHQPGRAAATAEPSCRERLRRVLLANDKFSVCHDGGLPGILLGLVFLGLFLRGCWACHVDALLLACQVLVGSPPEYPWSGTHSYTGGISPTICLKMLLAKELCACSVPGRLGVSITTYTTTSGFITGA